MSIADTRVTMQINGQDYEFGILGPRSNHQIVEWANAQMLKSVRESMPDAKPTEIAQALRLVGKTYDISDIQTLLHDGDNLLYMIYLSFVKANPGVSWIAFLELVYATPDDIPNLMSNIDKINTMLQAKTEAAESTDPPPVAE